MSGQPPTGDRDYPTRLIWYTNAIAVAALPVVGWSAVAIATTPFEGRDLLGVAVFALAAIVAEALPVPLDDTGSRSVSLAFVFLLAAQLLFGWAYAVPAAVLAMSLNQLRERVERRRAVFNTAVYAIATFLSAVPGFLLGWDARLLAPTDAGRLTVLAFTGGACFVLSNVALIAVAVTLARGVPLRGVIDDYIRTAGPAFTIMAFIATLATSLWKISAPLEVLLAGPLLSLGLYQRYAYRTVLATRDASTDGLTMLNNHRAFQADLQAAIDLPDLEELALVTLDIDDFKAINDQFGHPTGDAVLKTVSRVLDEVFAGRGTYRVGGEEFAVLLLGHGAEEARLLVEPLHERLRETAFAHGLAVSVSAGIAAFPSMAADRDELVRCADSALYWAKEHGKAQSCVYAANVVQVRSRQDIGRQAERQARLRAAENLIQVVDARDTYTGLHSQTVSRLAVAIGRNLDLDATLLEQVRLAGLLHDLGKIAIPDRILQKPGRLDDDEMAVLRQHPEIGYRLLDGCDVAPVDLWIRHHHEAWDGSGYPHGLVGDEIPIGSRIILVADAFDAMTSDRAYRTGGTVEHALAELRRCSWSQFDARVVNALETHIAAAGDALEATG